MGDTTEDVRIDAAKAAETSVSKAEYRISQKSESEPIVKSDLKEGSAVRKSRTERGKADTGDDDSSRGEESVSQGIGETARVGRNEEAPVAQENDVTGEECHKEEEHEHEHEEEEEENVGNEEEEEGNVVEEMIGEKEAHQGEDNERDEEER